MIIIVLINEIMTTDPGATLTFAIEVVVALLALDFGLHVRPVGLTGGIACGKSTVSSFFCQCHVPVVDADKIASTVLDQGTSAYKVVNGCR